MKMTFSEFKDSNKYISSLEDPNNSGRRIVGFVTISSLENLLAEIPEVKVFSRSDIIIVTRDTEVKIEPLAQ